MSRSPESALGRRGRLTAAATVAAAMAVAGALLDGCGLRGRFHPQPAVAVDPVAATWAETLDGARAALAGGRPAQADSMLSTFRDRHVGVPQSAEALYWRALARLDLPTPASGVRPALADLDAYRASPAPEHIAEAAALRRALVQLDSVRAVPAAVTERAAQPSTRAPVAAPLVSRDSLRALDDELQRARADAAAARAELDRVRRRLAAPGRRPVPPGPPGA